MKEKVIDILVMLLNKIPKTRELYFHRDDVMTILDVLQEVSIGIRTDIGNCGWAKAPDCYYVVFTVNDEKYFAILQAIANRNIEILPPTVGY